MDLIRGSYKELHPGGEYAKGKGRESKAWREEVYPSALWVPIYNAKGNRQDAAFDGSMSLFANWNIKYLEFLNGLVNVPRAENILEKFLWRAVIAAMICERSHVSTHCGSSSSRTRSAGCLARQRS